METVTDFVFLGSNITADGDCSHEIKICLLLGRKAMTNLHSILKSRDTSCLQRWIVKTLVFLKVMYRWASWKIKKGCVLKNWCLQTVVLEKTLENPFDCKEIKPWSSVSLQWNQSWLLIGRTDAEAEAPIFWPPDTKSLLIGKDPELRKIEGRRRRGQTEDEMVGWHQWTWVRGRFGRRWRTGMPVMLQSMGSQRVRHDCVTEQQSQRLNLFRIKLHVLLFT